MNTPMDLGAESGPSCYPEHSTLRPPERRALGRKPCIARWSRRRCLEEQSNIPVGIRGKPLAPGCSRIFFCRRPEPLPRTQVLSYSLHCAKGGAVETGCSGLHHVIGLFYFMMLPPSTAPPPNAPPYMYIYIYICMYLCGRLPI